MGITYTPPPPILTHTVKFAKILSKFEFACFMKDINLVNVSVAVFFLVFFSDLLQVDCCTRNEAEAVDG